jgi:ankyrin repeat protein
MIGPRKKFDDPEIDCYKSLEQAYFSNDHGAIAQLLQTHPEFIEEINEPGLESPLAYSQQNAAVEQGDIEVFNQLLQEKKIDFKAGIDGRSPLLQAVFYGHSKIVDLLLQQSGVADYLNVPDNLGYTPLHWACERGSTELAKKLLKAEGIEQSLRYRDENNGFTPLHNACRLGERELVQQLLLHPSSKDALNIVDKTNQTPLDLAYEYNNDEVAALLRHAGGEISSSHAGNVDQTPIVSMVYEEEGARQSSKKEGKPKKNLIAAIILAIIYINFPMLTFSVLGILVLSKCKAHCCSTSRLDLGTGQEAVANSEQRQSAVMDCHSGYAGDAGDAQWNYSRL